MVLLDDYVYKETKDLVLGKREKSPLLLKGVCSTILDSYP